MNTAALLLFLAAVGAEPQVILTRAMVVQRAAAEHPKVAATHAEVDRAEARQGQVRAARFPELQVLLTVTTALQGELVDEHGVRSTRSAYDFNLTRDLSAAFGGQLTVIQPLYTFGKLDLRAEAAEHGLYAAKAQVDMTRAEVALEAARLYELNLYARSVLLFLEDVEGIAKKSLEETEALLAAGAAEVTPQDKLRLEAALGLTAVGRHRAEAGIAQTSAGLRAYLGLPTDQPVALADGFLEALPAAPGSLEDLIGMALERRPELMALRHGIEAREKLAEAQEADYFPDLFAVGFVSGAYTPGRDFVTSRYVLDPLGHFLPGLGVGARWTLQWDGAGQRAKEARADVTALEQLFVWAQAGLPAEVERAYRDLVRFRADLAKLAVSLPQAKQWMVRASADYSAGLGPSSEISDAVQAYVALRVAELDAAYGVNVALAELARATGTLGTGDLGLYPGGGAR
ncbi:MAG: TolC family protein [Myxococcales bacterium]|nr:TolC family protein [Myxococcales bacterium]